MNKIKTFFLLLILSVSFISCSKKITQPQVKICMGTVCSINAYDDGTAELYEKLFSALNHIDETFSSTIPDSQVSQINSNAGIQPVEICRELYSVLEQSIFYAEKSNGAFDPTIGPLVNLWAINTDAPHVPNKSELTEALSLVDYKRLLLNNKNETYTAFLEKKGMKIELGGIAKGYAADVLCSILKENNVKKAMIDLGGNIYAYGKKEDGTAWKIGIKNPDDGTNIAAVVEVDENKTVVTSGVYERFFISERIRYHHILDTKTGFPSNGGKSESFNKNLLSTTIVCSSSLMADALSTISFLLGPEAFFKLLEEPEFKNVKAVFITQDHTMIAHGFENGFTVYDQSYSLEK